MVTIRIFIPHIGLQQMIEEAVQKINRYENIRIEMTHIFGTPEYLFRDWKEDILVARGITYANLHKKFPGKHIIQIQFTSYDIVDAIFQCRDRKAKHIGVFVNDIPIYSKERLEELCGAKISIFNIHDEESIRKNIEKALEMKCDMFVGAGTLCGLCEMLGLEFVHIKTKNNAVEVALKEAIRTAKTINMERERTSFIETMLNNSEDGLIAIDAKEKITYINNQVYRMFQLSTFHDLTGSNIAEILDLKAWKKIFDETGEVEKVIVVKDRNYLIHVKPFHDVGTDCNEGALVIIRNTDQIIAQEGKVRRELSEKGLMAKYSFKDIVGKSPQIKENIFMAEKYSKVNSNVLIIGETGTGKELFAHSIHNSSKRCDKPFVALNCAALPENLLESELFGYEPGAFSGASKTGKMGLFELAHQGTIFLDEIGEIPINLQAKLLRVLQEKEIRRIGSTRVHTVDVRVISATNINIEQKIKEGKFRSDLYYRLNLLDINVDPLRERKEDIVELFDLYITRFACEMGKKIPVITEEAKEILRNYEWLGNVRELRNICERLIVLNEENLIDKEILKKIRLWKEVGDEVSETPQSKEEDDLEYYLENSDLSKEEIASKMGISRTTLWRMEKKRMKGKR